MTTKDQDWDEFRVRLHAALERADAERLVAFFPTADEFCVRTVRQVLESTSRLPEHRQAALLGSSGLTALIAASESVSDRVRADISDDLRAIYEMVALNAHDLAALGIDGIFKLEARIGHHMLDAIRASRGEAGDLLDKVKFWTMISVARGLWTRIKRQEPRWLSHL